MERAYKNHNKGKGTEMAVYISKRFLKKMDRVKEKESWTVRELTEILEMPERTVRGHMERKDFSVIEGMKVKKVLSQSVVDFYDNKFKKFNEKVRERTLERIQKTVLILRRDLDKILKPYEVYDDCDDK
jgi:hypothetical protein